MNLKKFMTAKLTVAGIIFIIFYQLIMVLVYIPGYQHINDHMDQTKIALVNNDSGKIGKKIKSSIEDGLNKKKNVPKVINYISERKAKKALESNNAMLVISIPHNTTNNLKNNKQVTLKYFNNKYAPSIESGIIRSVQASLNNTLNSNINRQVNIGILTKIMMKNEGINIVKNKMLTAINANQSIRSNPKLQNSLKQDITRQVIKSMENKASKYVSSNIIREKTTSIGYGNPNMSMIIGSMLVALGCFIGIMSASMLVFSEFKEALNAKTGRLKAFGFYELSLFTMSLLGPILSTLSFKFIVGISTGAALQMYIQSSLLTLIAAQYVSIFTMLFGKLGILFNLPMALVQTISSGAMAPISMLPLPYQLLSKILPIPFTYKSYISIFSGVGTNKILNNDIRLIILGLVAALITYVIVRFKKFNKEVDSNIS